MLYCDSSSKQGLHVLLFDLHIHTARSLSTTPFFPLTLNLIHSCDMCKRSTARHKMDWASMAANSDSGN